MLDRNQKYLTSVANHNMLTSNIKYPILKVPYIDKKGISITNRLLIRALSGNYIARPIPLGCRKLQTPLGLGSGAKVHSSQEHYTKPQQTILRPKTLDKTFKTYMQNPKIFDKDQKHLTRVASNSILTANIQYPILKVPVIIKKY